MQYKMPSPPEEELLSFCEANAEWCELRDQEAEAWLALEEADKPRHGCEPRDAVELRRLNKKVGWSHLVGKRVRAQARLRLDRTQSHRNLNEQ